MDFFKSNVMGGSSNNPESDVTDIQNASALEEPASPTDLGARRASDDPLAENRRDSNTDVKWDMFADRPDDAPPEIPMSQRERRMSKEWDASKVPPSRFQKREGSIHATPASRDGHIDRNKLRDFVNKHKKERRKSST